MAAAVLTAVEIRVTAMNQDGNKIAMDGGT